MRTANWIYDLVQDLRFGARMLAKNPGFTTVAVLADQFVGLLGNSFLRQFREVEIDYRNREVRWRKQGTTVSEVFSRIHAVEKKDVAQESTELKLDPKVVFAVATPPRGSKPPRAVNSIRARRKDT